MLELSGPSLGINYALVLVMGFTTYMTGQALANTWKPVWQAVIYTCLLGLADRFLAFALFDEVLLTGIGYLADTALLVVIVVVAHRLNLARKMVSQYPWLYESAGPFRWREKRPGGA